MKSTTRKSAHKKAIVLSVIALAIVAGGIVSAIYIPKLINYYNQQKAASNIKNGVNYNPATSAQKQAGDTVKYDSATSASSGSTSATDSGTTTPATTSMIISSTPPASGNGTYELRTIIYVLDNNGSCTLTMTKQGSSDYTQTVGTEVLSSYSVCEGFNIAMNSLQAGNWQAEVIYTGSAGQSASAQQLVTVQ